MRGRSGSRWLTIWVTAFGKSVPGLSNRIARTLFAVVDEEIVLLHGFIKKQQRTPPDELDLAKKRKKQYLQNI